MPTPESEKEPTPSEHKQLPNTLSQQPPEARAHHGYWEFPGESPEFYEKFGVQTYKKFVPTSGDHARRIFRFNYGGLKSTASVEDQLKDAIFFTKANEIVHLGFMALMAHAQVTGEQSFKNIAYGPRCE